jgi:hypothetical protein
VEFNCAVHAPFFAAAYYLGGWFTRVKCGDTSGSVPEYGILRNIKQISSLLSRNQVISLPQKYLRPQEKFKTADLLFMVMQCRYR